MKQQNKQEVTKMTLEEKALKMMQELIEAEKRLGNFEKAGAALKKHYKLTDQQFAGFILKALGN